MNLRLKVALRTPGRGIILECGLEGLEGSLGDFSYLSAKEEGDVEYIKEIPTTKGCGVVVIDHFNLVDDGTKERFAHYMKRLADREDKESKIILVGRGLAEELIGYAEDLVLRVEVI